MTASGHMQCHNTFIELFAWMTMSLLIFDTQSGRYGQKWVNDSWKSSYALAFCNMKSKLSILTAESTTLLPSPDCFSTLQASVRCLRKKGRLLEIGKYDILRGSTLSMRPLLQNIGFDGIDLDRVFNDPDDPSEVSCHSLILATFSLTY